MSPYTAKEGQQLSAQHTAGPHAATPLPPTLLLSSRALSAAVLEPGPRAPLPAGLASLLKACLMAAACTSTAGLALGSKTLLETSPTMRPSPQWMVLCSLAGAGENCCEGVAQGEVGVPGCAPAGLSCRQAVSHGEKSAL